MVSPAADAAVAMLLPLVNLWVHDNNQRYRRRQSRTRPNNQTKTGQYLLLSFNFSRLHQAHKPHKVQTISPKLFVRIKAIRNTGRAVTISAHLYLYLSTSFHSSRTYLPTHNGSWRAKCICRRPAETGDGPNANRKNRMITSFQKQRLSSDYIIN